MEKISHNDREYVLSKFDNVISVRTRSDSMPWHADIPNKIINPFPIRSLWITENPNPTQSGITGFLNISYPEKRLSKHLRDNMIATEIIQQSWYLTKDATYTPGRDMKSFPLIKIHPVTGEKSLRLNYFNKPGFIDNAWICGVKINGELLHDCSVVEQYINELSMMKDRTYYHIWDTHDIVIYDNWSFVHNRSELKMEPDQRRHFYRANIDHDFSI